MERESLTETLRETLALFAEPGTPQTTSEIAERLDLGRRATYGRLERLAEREALETKKVGANARVWWRPAAADDEAVRPSAGADAAPRDREAAAESLVGDVLDAVEVGVFVLDENFDVAWINAATERYFGLDRERVLGRDKRTLVDEEIEPVVEESPAFAETVRSTYDDNAGPERFECRVAPGGSREERWLEHRSEPIESGAYAGGRVELYYDVTARKRTERARSEERREFASLVEAVEEYAIFTLDPEGYVRTWNPGAERIKGYEAEEIVGEHFSTFYAEADREAGVPEENLEAAAEAGSIEEEGWRRRKDGSRFWANVTLTAIRDDDGELVGFAKVTRDMSDRRERERQLRRERDLTDRLFETAPVRLVVFDADGEVERLNSRGRRELGVDESADEFLESVTLLDPDGDPLPPEDSPLRRALKRGEFVSDTVVRHATTDGEMPWTSLTAAPIFDDGGDVDRVVVAGQDITELKETERRLERRRDELTSELRDVFGRVDDAFYALDEELRFDYVNDRAADLLGHSEAELLGRNVWDVLSVDEDDPIRERFRTAMATQEPVTFERHSDPLGIWETVSVYPSESGLSVYFTDITERKETERRLKRYERIVETVDDGVYALDENERFTLVNDAFCEIVGYDREELLGRHPTLVNSESVNRSANEIESEIIDGDREFGVLEYEFERSDGERVPVETRFGPLEYGDGRVGRCGVTRDITERKERERELEEHRRWTRALIENFPNGAVAIVDDDRRFTAFGGTPSEGEGVTRDDLEGGRLREVLPPKSAELFTPRYEAALDGEPSEFEESIDGRDYQYHFVPVRDDDGDVFAAIGMSQEITERKERERELREAKLQLEAATEAGAVGTWEWNVPEDRFVAGPSFARTFGVDPDAARQGVPLEQFLSAIHEDDRERVEREIDGALSSCGEYEAEYRVRGVDGEYRWVIARGHVECDDGEPVTFPGAITDITDRKEAEMELERNRQRVAALNNLHGVVRDITDAVIDKSSREEIESTVCERLAGSDSYTFAWIGDVDVGTQTMNLRTETGVEGFLDGITISVDPDDELSQGPTGRALRTGEIQTTQDVRADDRHDPWRGHVEEYGYRSSAAIPIVHEETTYGALNVYADRPHAFEGQEQTVIEQLGEVVGHAIAAAERERALLSDEVVELEFHVRDALDELGVDGSPAPIEFEHAVPLGDGEYLVFGSAPPEAVPTVEAIVEASPYWEGVDVGKGEDRTVFEVRVTDSPLLSALSAHGGTFDAAAIEGGDIGITLHVPAASDVRAVIDAVGEEYPRATLQRRTQTTRRRGAAESDRGGLLAGLTERQRATLETAYYSGFFEWPRGATGEEVAEAIGVAPPTFHQHLRKAERRVFDGIFSSAT